MMKLLCFVLLLSFIISVSSNPLSQLVQNICQPTSYSNPTSIQQTSNIKPYPQGTTVQVSSGSQSPLGDTWNQIILNRILSNPSLQKIIDPNTKLYNQNGEEVQRRVPNTGAPNVINNYFIVPPEFFNLNETEARNRGETLNNVVDKTVVKRPDQMKRKKRPRIVELSAAEEDDKEVKLKTPAKRRKQKEPENVKRKTKRIKEVNESVEVIDEYDESQELSARRKQQNEKNEQRLRLKKKDKEQLAIPSSIIEESDENLQEIEKPPQHREKEINRSRKYKSKKVIDDRSHEISEQTKTKQDKDHTLFSNNIKESESNNEMFFEKKARKEQRKELENIGKNSDDKILKNIELPTDISNQDISEIRQSRDSKRKTAKREPKHKIANATENGPKHNITPFQDDVLKNWFPYMPMGNFNNPNSNYPYNFAQYYQYLDPVRNSNANKNKKKRKNQNRSNNDATSNIHTIEIKLKPKKKANYTENLVTTEKSRAEHELSIEVDQSTESLEIVTDIPMKMPHKVSPVIKDVEKESSKESYETFSKLEYLHEFITPELGKEDEVPAIDDNAIINDYYPVFDVDVYYNPYADKVKTLEDDRYFYETGNEDHVNREPRKLDRYEDFKGPKKNFNGRKLENPDFKTTKVDPRINKFDSKELDDIPTFSDLKSPVIDTLKSSAEIRRVKVPSKNIRVKTENVETVFAGSKVAKYGVPLDEAVEDTSIYAHDSDESSYSSDGRTTYIVAKSLGRPEDYW